MKKLIASTLIFFMLFSFLPGMVLANDHVDLGISVVAEQGVTITQQLPNTITTGEPVPISITIDNQSAVDFNSPLHIRFYTDGYVTSPSSNADHSLIITDAHIGDTKIALSNKTNSLITRAGSFVGYDTPFISVPAKTSVVLEATMTATKENRTYSMLTRNDFGAYQSTLQQIVSKLPEPPVEPELTPLTEEEQEANAFYIDLAVAGESVTLNGNHVSLNMNDTELLATAADFSTDTPVAIQDIVSSFIKNCLGNNGSDSTEWKYAAKAVSDFPTYLKIVPLYKESILEDPVSNQYELKGLATGEESAPVQITATKDAPVKPTEPDPEPEPEPEDTVITLDQENVTIYTNKEPNQVVLTATVTPEDAANKTINWTSEDESVATVDENGLVKAVADGKAVITATVDNVTAKCVVTVETYQKPVPPKPTPKPTPNPKPDTSASGSTADKHMNVNIKAVSQEVVKDVENLVQDDKNLSLVGGTENSLNLTATKDGQTITEYAMPVDVKVDLDRDTLKDVKDPSKLTFAKVSKTARNSLSLEFMGGTYNHRDGSFDAKLDNSGDYVLMEKDNLTKLTMQIGNKKTTLNDKAHTNDVAPCVIHNRTMMPLRYIGESLGADVAWNEKTRMVTVKKDGVELKMIIDQPLDAYGAAPVIRDSRTFVPIRYISEALSSNVIYDPIEREIIVVH